MTEQTDDLVKRLRSYRAPGFHAKVGICTQAANRIEAYEQAIEEAKQAQASFVHDLGSEWAITFIEERVKEKSGAS